MKTTPTAAIEVLLGLPPLHIMIEAEALAGICRLMCNKQWRPKSTNFGHTTKISGHGTHPTDGNRYVNTKICLSQAIHSQLP